MLLAALVGRAVVESQAVKLLRALAPDQPVMDQIEYIDSIIQRGRIENPPGFYVSMLKENIPVPDCFETTARRTARQARERDYFEKQTLEFEQNSRYEEYLRTELDRHIAEVLGDEQFSVLVKACLPDCKKKYPNVPQPTLVEIAESSVRCDLRQALPVLSFDEFRQGHRQSTLF
jgi:hypothetical protein